MTLPTKVWKCTYACFLLLFTGLAYSETDVPPLLQVQNGHFITTADGLPSNYVDDVTIGPQGFLWVSTARELVRYDGKKFTSANDINSIEKPSSARLLGTKDRLWAADKDRLWILSSDRSWASFVLPNHNQRTVQLNHISSAKNNRLLLATTENLIIFDEQTHSFKEQPLRYSGQPITGIRFIHFHNDWFWLSTVAGGIYVWDGSSENVFSITKSNPITDKLDATNLYALTSFNDNLWLATDNGIKVLNDELRKVPTPKAIEKLNEVIVDIKVHDKQLFIATEKAVYTLNSGALEQLTTGDITGKLTFNVNGDLYIATASNGLYEIPTNYAPAILKSFTRPNKLSGNTQSDLPDSLKQASTFSRVNNHNYWLESDLGIVHYDFAKEEIIEIVPPPNQEQIKDIEAYSDNVYLLTLSHQLYRYNTVTQTWLPIPLNYPPTDDFWLTRLGDTLWLHSDKAAFPINDFSEIGSKQTINNAPSLFYSSLAIDTKQMNKALNTWFSIPFFSPVEELIYRYRLDSDSDKWAYLTHSELPLRLEQSIPGIYQLTVQASIDGENWSAESQTRYRISHSFWSTPYAYISYLAISFLLLVIVIALYRHKLKRINTVIASLDGQAKALRFSRSQYWQWDLSTGELLRQHIWPQCPAFPVDGRRLKSPQSTSSNIHPSDVLRMQSALDKHLNGDSEYYECSYRINNNGNWLWVLDQGCLERTNGSAVMHGTLSDVSSLVSSQDRIDMLAASITNISDGICIFDRFFKKVEVNKAFERILGYPREQVLSKSFHLDLYSEEFTNQIKRTVIKEGTWRGELSDLKADGSEFLMELTLDAVHDDEGDLSFIVASFSDVTERQRTESELRRLSNTDTLTGLPNRSYFQVSHSNLVRKKVSHTLLLFDLDDFKKINDSLGHEVGDDLLCLVAERLMDISRRQDTLYRLGGDEFGLLIEDSTDLHLIGDLAHKINRTIAEPYSVNNHDIVIGSSIGIVLFPHDGITSQELLQKADMAMYHAKQRGGNCYQFFSQSMNENAVQRLKLENQLRVALKNNGVEVSYQPKIEVHTGHIAGIEALARIKSEDGSQISPADFIPLAEETGLIIELGEQVLRQSCQAMKTFMQYAGSPKTIAINLSARQFMQSGLALQIESILREESLQPRHVEFEITEGMVMSDPERAIIMMENLSDMGVKLALDDFGTGYSSLAYLKRFPMDSLKIDKAFIDDITTSPKDRSMVASIIGMAHNLGLKVIAEGVESEAQLEQLKSLECEYIQGFYYAKPMPADDFIEFIKQHTADVIDV